MRPETRSRSSTLIPRAANTASSSSPKSSPTTPTTETSVKKLAASEKWVAAPPSTRSRLPNGVSSESKATDPTTVTDIADGDTTGYVADLALRRDRPLLGRVQHRGPRDRVLRALRRARPARARRRLRNRPAPRPVAEGRPGRRRCGRLRGHARALRASAPRARDCLRRCTPSRCTSSTFLAATGRSSSAAGSASASNRERTTSRRSSASTHHLEPGGTLVFDNEVPYASERLWHFWARSLGAARGVAAATGERRRGAGRSRIRARSRALAVDPLAQSATLEMRARMWRDGELVAEETHSIDLMFYFRDELVLMLERAGFRDVDGPRRLRRRGGDAGERLPRLQRDGVAAAATSSKSAPARPPPPPDRSEAARSFARRSRGPRRGRGSRSSRASACRSRALRPGFRWPRRSCLAPASTRRPWTANSTGEILTSLAASPALARGRRGRDGIARRRGSARSRNARPTSGGFARRGRTTTSSWLHLRATRRSWSRPSGRSCSRSAPAGRCRPARPARSSPRAANASRPDVESSRTGEPLPRG